MTSTEFRSARLQLGLTQSELGKIMRMSQQAIGRIDNGERQPTKIQDAFIRVLNFIHAAGMMDKLQKKIL